MAASASLRAIGVALVTLLAPLSLSAQAPAAETLTNQSVIGMVVGKLGKDLILAKISSTKNEFDMTASGIVNLHQSKVAQDVIRSMMSAATDPKLGRPRPASEVVSNQGVIAMATAGVPRPLILAKVGSTPNEFDVTVTGIVALHQNKVHAEVMSAMITAAMDAKLGRSKANAAEVLSNQSVVAMVEGGVPKQIILSKIQNTKVQFDVSSTGMVSLNQSKVPQDVIKAMVVRSSSSN